MENRAHAIVVGIFTLLFSAALLFAFWWLSGARVAYTEYVVISKFPVTGLNAEATVRFRGVKVGKVTQISLDPASRTSILIRVKVEESLQLSKETYAELRMQGMTGLAYVDLNDVGTSAIRLKTGEKIPLQASPIDRLLDQAPVLISQIETLLKTSSETAASANRFFNKVDTEKLNKTLGNLESAAGKLDPLLSSATTTLNRVSGMVSEKHQAQFLQTLVSMQKTADDIRPLVVELRETAQDVRSMSYGIKLNSKQLSDTLNYETLPQLHQLTQNVNQNALHFDQLIDMLKDNPQSLIFGVPEAIPGPGEAGFNSKP